jgi:hypothetical protein
MAVTRFSRKDAERHRAGRAPFAGAIPSQLRAIRGLITSRWKQLAAQVSAGLGASVGQARSAEKRDGIPPFSGTMQERTRIASAVHEKLARACGQAHRLSQGAVLWDFDPALWAANGKNTPVGEKPSGQLNLVAIQTANGEGNEQYHRVNWFGDPGTRAWIELQPRGGGRAVRLPVLRDDSAPPIFRV